MIRGLGFRVNTFLCIFYWFFWVVNEKIDNLNRTWNCAPTWSLGEYTLGILSREWVGNFPLGNIFCAFATFDFYQGKYFLCKVVVSARKGLSILFPFYLFIYYYVWLKSTRGYVLSLECFKQGPMSSLLSNSLRT